GVRCFLMVADQRGESGKRLERRSNFFSNNRMLLHDSSLLRVQRPGFEKDAFWHANLPYVVKPTGDAVFVQVFFSKAEAFSQLLRESHKAFRVAVPQVLF